MQYHRGLLFQEVSSWKASLKIQHHTISSSNMYKLTLDNLSLGSLKGSLLHGWKSAKCPYKLTMFFSQLAQDHPPRGFLANIASSSFSWWFVFNDIRRSYRFFSCFSSYLRAFFVSFLSANLFIKAWNSSFIFSNSLYSSSCKASIGHFVLSYSWTLLNAFYTSDFNFWCSLSKSANLLSRSLISSS